MFLRGLLCIGLALASDSPPASSPAPCPDGSSMAGKPWPDGTAYWCQKRDERGDFVIHGWFVSYYAGSGKRREECEYRDGLRHGRCTFYGENGERDERGYWERDQRAREAWLWTLPPEHDDDERVPVAKAAEAHVLVERRTRLEKTLSLYGAAEADAASLTAMVLAYVDETTDTRTVVCGSTLCVAPGRDGEPIYVRASPNPAEIDRDRDAVTKWEARANADSEREEKAAAAELRRKIKQYKAAVARYEQQERQWGRTRLQCSDGTRSPSCTCGGGHGGCCSHHGGVAGCPREYPTAPVRPREMAEAP